jgi:hypothetical protein
MSPFALDLEKTKIGSSLVRLEPALNAFGSMLLISKGEDEPGIHEWVTKTSLQMSSEEQSRHKLVMIGFHYSILPQVPSASFETYLDSLDATSPSEFRERLLSAYEKICFTEDAEKKKNIPVDWDEILSSPKDYVEFLGVALGTSW